MTNTEELDNRTISNEYNYLVKSGLAKEMQIKAKQILAKQEEKRYRKSKTWLNKYKVWKNNYIGIHGENPDFKAFISMLSYEINN